MTVRPIFLEEHEQFRDSVRRFVQASVVPHHRRWEAEGRVPRELWLEAGAAGLLCTGMPEEYGGSDADFRFSTIIIEELAKVGAHGPGFSLHSDIVAPYILHYGSEAQKRHWLPRMARGEIITAIAMTEPGTGSDLAGVRTRATAAPACSWSMPGSTASPAARISTSWAWMPRTPPSFSSTTSGCRATISWAKRGGASSI